MTESGTGTDAAARVAVVGLGYWGPNLLRVLTDMREVEVRYICDLDGERLARYARRYPASSPTTEFDELLADPELDAVLLATPVFTHYELAAASLAAHKHTFVEKPLAPSVREAEALMESAEQADLELMCGHTFLYSPPVRTIQRMLANRELGELYFISSSRVNLGLHQRDISVIWDLAPHDFSILRCWLGCLPNSISVLGRDSIVTGIADVAFIQMTYDSGLIVNVEISWLAPGKLRRTVLVGSDKMVVYEDGAPEPVRIFDHGVDYHDPETFGEFQLLYRTGDITSPSLDVTEPLADEVSDFIGAVRTGDRHLAQLRVACDVVHLLEAAQRSLSAGGAAVALTTGSAGLVAD